MQTKHLPRLSGIYQIVNAVNGKFYVGSTVDLQVRAHQHRMMLREKRHENRKLQHAWNKYGAIAFSVRVLEEVADKSQLIAREQYWLDTTQACKVGYNICSQAGSCLGVKQTQERRDEASSAKSQVHPGFISPEGVEVTIHNLRAFCKEHGLTRAAMSALSNGRATLHKGWTHVNAKPRVRNRINTYEGFIDPEGNPVGPITNLQRFARERGLDASVLHAVWRGKKPSHHGWSHINSASKRHTPKRVTTYEGFINPDGERVTITNLTKFCRDNALDQSTMWRVIKGKERQHKGWTYSPV